MTQAITDIKELVGEREAEVCECTLSTCPDRHATRRVCGRSPQWMARVHAIVEGGEHQDRVLKMCDACLSAARAHMNKRIQGMNCGCGTFIRNWVGPVMPL